MKIIWRKPTSSRKMRKKQSGPIKVWMLKKICQSEPRMGAFIVAGWMEGALNIMAWTPNEAARMAKEASFAAKVYRGIVERHQNHWHNIEKKRIAKMYQEAGYANAAV